MQATNPEFDSLISAYEWCDGRCRRCPLRDECSLSDRVARAEDASCQPLDQRLRRAALDYTIALGELACEADDAEESDDERDPVLVARHAAAVIGLKVEHIANILVDDLEELDSVDTSQVNLNLLLVERLDQSAIESAWFIAAQLGSVPHEFLEAHANLFELLGPLFEKIPDATRERVDALIATGRAPSPFCEEIGLSFATTGEKREHGHEQSRPGN